MALPSRLQRFLLDSFKKNIIDWAEYETQFTEIMKDRNIEAFMSDKLEDGDCLLCSEDSPKNCHRRLVAEFLNEKLGNIDINHL